MSRTMNGMSACLVALAFGIAGCGGGAETMETTPPATPTGLTAVPGDASVRLTWSANTEGDLAGYDVFKGTASGALAKVSTVAAPGTTQVVAGLANGTPYYFAIAAVDASGNASPMTDEVAATPFAPDVTPPTVSLTEPATTTGVAVATGITLAFNEDMDPASVSVTLAPTVALDAPSWTDARTVRVLPASALAYDTSYTVTVAGEDLAGNPLAGTVGFTFVTVNPPDTTSPTVTGTSPADGATGVPISASIAFAFSEAMNHASVEGAFGASPAITCAWAWSADSTLATCTHADLAGSTPYQITLGTGAADLAGNHLQANKVVAFTTGTDDFVRPTVASSVPAAGATGQATGVNISVTFSEAMDKASAQQAFAIVSPTGYGGGLFTWSADGKTMTYDPPTAFANGVTVSWRVSTAAEDLAGNTLAADENRSFRVIQRSSATLYSVAALDGTVYSAGTANSASTWLMVGDAFNNTFTRGFLSFDLSSLPPTTTSIVSATLYAYQSSVVGAPYAGLGGLVRAESVSYGPTLTFADFETPILQTCIKLTCRDEVVTLSNSTTLGTKSVDATRKVQDDWANRVSRVSRSQYRLKFPTNTDVDGVSDYVRFLTGETTNGTNRPRLVVTYEHP